VPGVQTVVNRIVTGIHEPRYHEAARGARHVTDIERTIPESRPVRGDMPERPSAPSTPPNVARADHPPHDTTDTP
jgi:hypothetical protein